MSASVFLPFFPSWVILFYRSDFYINHVLLIIAFHTLARTSVAYQILILSFFLKDWTLILLGVAQHLVKKQTKKLEQRNSNKSLCIQASLEDKVYAWGSLVQILCLRVVVGTCYELLKGSDSVGTCLFIFFYFLLISIQNSERLAGDWVNTLFYLLWKLFLEFNIPISFCILIQFSDSSKNSYFS